MDYTVTLVSNTKTKELRDVVFEDVNELVSSQDEAWCLYNFLWRYFTTREAAEKWLGRRINDDEIRRDDQ